MFLTHGNVYQFHEKKKFSQFLEQWWVLVNDAKHSNLDANHELVNDAKL